MRILVVGGGGREHALVSQILLNPQVERVYCAPGNAGTGEVANNIDIQVTDLKGLLSFALAEAIDFTVVGPEAPLVEGIVDLFHSQGLKIFGPTKKAAQLEGSKSFANNIMEKYRIPTGKTQTFSALKPALEYLQMLEGPYVIKADGLAAGKGVYIAEIFSEAEQALKDCLELRKFGSAGDVVVIEEYLSGQEVSVLAFTDGKSVLPLTAAQDYKRIFDCDLGPNTGGMGSYSPVPLLSDELFQKIIDEIMVPTVKGMAAEGIPYKGILYGGIIMTDQGPKVLEFNCRFGDPETQAILPRMESDLVKLMLSTIEGTTSKYRCNWSERVCVSVVLASKGYPASSSSGDVIRGLDEAASFDDVSIFHAGTAVRNGDVVSAGGRVLNVSALGRDFVEARELAFEAIDKISFEGMQFRRDIAKRAVEKVKHV